MVDIHCHLLPGIDDGPEDWTETLALAKMFADAGIGKVIMTPHFIPGVYSWAREEGEALHRELMERLRREDLALETFLSAEVGIFPELPEWMSEGKIPLMPTERHILLETPMYGSEAMLRDMAYAVLSVGVTPIFAHPERSPLFMEVGLARDLVASEGVLQLDAGGLIGRWGGEIKRISMNLIDAGLVRYVASDSHGPGRREPSEFVMAAEEVEKLWGPEIRKALFHENPLELTKVPPKL